MYLIPTPQRLSPRHSRGFSLVELLAVLALVGLLASFSSLSLKGNGGSRSLGTAGTQCANLLESARETAILKKSPVAVAFLPATMQSPAALTALLYQPDSGTWTRISKWEKLPTGVVFDPSVNAGYNGARGADSPAVSPALPALDYAGTSLDPGVYGYLVFLPSGALHQTHSHPDIVRLAEGNVGGGTFHPTGAAGNYFDVVVNPTTGRLKLVRP